MGSSRNTGRNNSPTYSRWQTLRRTLRFQLYKFRWWGDYIQIFTKTNESLLKIMVRSLSQYKNLTTLSIWLIFNRQFFLRENVKSNYFKKPKKFLMLLLYRLHVLSLLTIIFTEYLRISVFYNSESVSYSNSIFNVHVFW